MLADVESEFDPVHWHWKKILSECFYLTRYRGNTVERAMVPGMIGLDLNVSNDSSLSTATKEARVISASLNSFNRLNHSKHRNVYCDSPLLFSNAVAAQPPRRMQLDVQFKF